ncbi:hypothetical protein MNBD_GAMMA13-219 [hydrothermal vent metagenome]|uniref:Type II secretion system protein GspC N-terminal domain-containing protein n=1 Tax=hydrothermal vent metagenome TaxID=652676 RepID=A0A3B0YXQ1_9ZZZZ
MNARRKLLPTALNLLLIVILAYGFSKLFASFPPKSPFKPSVAATQQQTKQPGNSRVSTLRHGEIVRESLAGRSPVQDFATLETSLQLVLRGVVAQADQHKGLAIIKKPGHKEKYFSVGDKVFDQGKLEEIHSDRVVLLRKEQHETLYLASRLDAEASRQPAAKAKNRRMPTGEEHVAFMREEMKKIHAMTLKKMKNPWQYVYYEPAMKDGKIIGLTFNAQEEKAFLSQHGIKLGDTIISVNGNDLDGDAGVARAMNALSGSNILELVIDRGGQKKTVVIRNDRKLN